MIKKFLRGFSLLEVMVALALLAISFTTLLLVQARATRFALEARTISIATQLARLQLMECKRAAQQKIATVSDYNAEGDFSELGFEKFRWECHAPKFSMKAPSGTELEASAKKQAPDAAKEGMNTSASAMSPVISLVADSLGNSVRELAVIIRWGEDSTADEVRVVTHVVDLAAMSALGKMLKQGAESLGGKKSESPEKEGSKEGPKDNNQPPPPPPPGAPGGRT